MKKLSHTLLSLFSSLLLASGLTGCYDNDSIFNIEKETSGEGFCIMPVSMIGEEIPYDSVPGEASGESRAINAMTVDRENMIKTIAIFQYDKENNLRTLKNGQYYLYHNFAEFGSSTPNGVSMVNIDNMPELSQLLTSTKSDLYTCVIANASRALIEDAILPGGSPADWPTFKEFSFPLPMATKADVENERDNLEYGHVTDIYMFGYYDGVVPPTGFTLGLGRVVSRIKIKFEAYENEEEHVSLDNLPSTARFFAAIRNLPRTGYFYPTTETPIQKSISDVYMLPELQFNPKSGSAILQFYCGPQLGSWIAENDNDGTPLRTQLLLWCATNPDEYEGADWNQYFLEKNIGKAVTVEIGNNPGAGDYGIVHNTVYSYTMGLGYGTSGIVITPINIFAMVWLDPYNDWKWESNIGQESNPLILNIDSRASKHNFEIKKIFNRDWDKRNDLGFVEYLIRNKRDWSQVALKDNVTQDGQIAFNFSTLSYSNLDANRLMLVGATENSGVYTGLETEGVRLLPLANGTATFDINLATDYQPTINGVASDVKIRTVHVTVPITGTFVHTLLPSKAPVSILSPGTSTPIANILDGVSFKPIKTYNGYTVHNGADFDIAASSLTAGTPVITGTGITIENDQIVAAADAKGTVTIPYTYKFPDNSTIKDPYKYPATLSYEVEIEVSNEKIYNIWTYNGSGSGLTLTYTQGDDNNIEPGKTNAVEAKVGDKIRITISSGNSGDIEFKDGWNPINGWKITLSSSNTKQEGDYYIFEQELTDSNSSVLINALKNKTLRVQGANVTITQIDLVTNSSSTPPATEDSYDFAMVWQKYVGENTENRDVYEWDTEHMGIKTTELPLDLTAGRVANGFKMENIFNHSWNNPTEVAPIEYLIVDDSKNPNVRLSLKQEVGIGSTDQVQYNLASITYNNLSTEYLKIEGSGGPSGVYLYPLQPVPSGQSAKFEVSIPTDPTGYTVESKKVTVNVTIDGTKFEHTITAQNNVTITNGMTLDQLFSAAGTLSAVKKYNNQVVHTFNNLQKYQNYPDQYTVNCCSGVTYNNGTFSVAEGTTGNVDIVLTVYNNNSNDLQTYKYPSTMTLTIPVGSSTPSTPPYEGSQLWHETTGGVMDENWNNYIQLAANDFINNNAKVGDKVRVYITDVGSEAQGAFKDPAGEWPLIGSPINLPVQEHPSYFELEITNDILSNLNTNGLAISGKFYTATHISLIAGSGGSQGNDPTPNTLPFAMDETMGDNYYKVPASTFNNAVVNSVIHAQISNSSYDAYGQFKINNGTDWNSCNSLGNQTNLNGLTEFTYTITNNTDLQSLKTSGLAVGGIKYTLTSVTVTNPSSGNDPTPPANGIELNTSGTFGWYPGIEISASQLKDIKEGDQIVVFFENSSGGQIRFNSPANGNNNNAYEIKSSSFTWDIPSDKIDTIKTNGLYLQGAQNDVTSAYLVPAP